MSQLTPPPTNRHRASSTCLRPPLSLPTLATRCSASVTLPSASDASSPQSPSSPGDPLRETSSGMIHVLVSRCLQLIHVLRPNASHKPSTLLDSPMASPRSSTDSECILPLSASHHKTSFGDVLSSPPHPPSLPHWPPSVHTPLLFVLLLFPLSTAFILFSLSTLPITASWPRTLADLAQLGRELDAYAQSGLLPTAHIIGVLSVSAIWKHAWSVPGSVLWNVLAGALFHPVLATILLTALTTIGSVFSTLLAKPLAPLLTRFFPRPLELTRSALEGSSVSDTGEPEMKKQTPAWVRLSILRLIGVVPWSGINIACGLTGVSLWDCVLGAFIGTLPWTAVTCQIGDILQTVNVGAAGNADGQRTVSSLLASPDIIVKLVFLSFLSLAPILGRDWLGRFISSPPPSSIKSYDVSACDEKDQQTEKQTSLTGETGRGRLSQVWTAIQRTRAVDVRR